MTAFTIAPIGTCRIHTRCATPWVTRSSATRAKLRLRAHQHRGIAAGRHTFGQGEIPADAAPDLPPSNGEQARRATHKRPTCTWSNCSSRKLLTIDGHPIQSNTWRAISASSSPIARAPGCSGPWPGPPGRGARRWNRMLQEPDAGKPRTAGRIVKRDLTDDEIEQEMRQLVELLGRDKVVFVTHVNAMTPDNADRTTRTTDRRGGREQPAHRRALLRPDAADEARPGRGDGRRRPGPDALHSAVRRAAVYRLVQDLHASAHERIRAAACRVQAGRDDSAERIEKLWEASCARPRAACATAPPSRPARPYACCSRASRKSWATTKASLALLDGADGALAAGSKAEQILMRNHFWAAMTWPTCWRPVLGDEIETRKSCASPRSAPAIWAMPTRRWATGSSCSASHRPTIRSPRSPPTRCSLLQASGDMDAAIRWVHEVRGHPAMRAASRCCGATA